MPKYKMTNAAAAAIKKAIQCEGFEALTIEHRSDQWIAALWKAGGPYPAAGRGRVCRCGASDSVGYQAS